MSDYITETQASDIVPVSRRTMQRYRLKGIGPDYYNIYGRIFYRKQPLIDWFETFKKRGVK